MAKLKDRLAALEDREKEAPSGKEQDAMVGRFSYISKVLSSFIPCDLTKTGLLTAAEAEQRMIAAGIPESEAKRFGAMGYVRARDELMPIHWKATSEIAREAREAQAQQARKPRIQQVREPGNWLQRIPEKR